MKIGTFFTQKCQKCSNSQKCRIFTYRIVNYRKTAGFVEKSRILENSKEFSSLLQGFKKLVNWTDLFAVQVGHFSSFLQDLQHTRENTVFSENPQNTPRTSTIFKNIREHTVFSWFWQFLTLFFYRETMNLTYMLRMFTRFPRNKNTNFPKKRN